MEGSSLSQPQAALAAPRTLAAPLRALLAADARLGRTSSYRELAARLNLQPPLTIHRVADALEVLMAEDAAAGAPLLAALCLGQGGLPRRGFFLKAAELGLFDGPADGAEARVFHALELDAVLARYRGGPA